MNHIHYFKLFESKTSILNDFLNRIKELYEYIGINDIKIKKEISLINDNDIKEISFVLKDKETLYHYNTPYNNPYPLVVLLISKKNMDIQFFRFGISYITHSGGWTKNTVINPTIKDRANKEEKVEGFITEVLEKSFNINLDEGPILDDDLPYQIDINLLPEILEKITIDSFELYLSIKKYNL